MSGINWSILSNALQTNPGDAFRTGMEQGATRSALGALAQNPNDSRAMNALAAFNPQAAMQMQDRTRQQQAAAREEQQRQERRRIGAIAGTNPTQAVGQAFAAGDLELARSIGQLDEEQRKAAWERTERLGGVVAQIRSLPPAQRRSAIQQMAPQLTGAFNFTPETIAAFDPTDQNLDLLLSRTMKAKDLLDVQSGGQYTIDNTRFDRNGNVIVQMPEFIPGGEGSLYRVDPAAPVRPGQPQTGSPGTVTRTSTPDAAPAMTPEQLRAAAESAIARGAPADAVNQRLQEQLRALGNGGATPAGSGNFPARY
jgi:hypothetical protein